ncbi:MAG: hypothetical protein ACKV2T_01895 [Kofleriaceae bacterium]
MHLLVVIALAAGCVQSNSTRCGSLVCAEGTTCAPAGDERCFDTDLVEACHARNDGDTCNVAGLPSGTCERGVCQSSRCGDGRVTGAEECDANDFDGRTCQALGFYSRAGLACTADCRYDTTACVGRCGDGVKNGPELCDSADMGTSTCFDAGFYAAPGLACKPDCTFDVVACRGGRCGDGAINGLEQCDSAAALTQSCGSLGYLSAMSGLSCSTNCTYTSNSCLCTGATRCGAWTQRCDCPKTGGCGCVAAM